MSILGFDIGGANIKAATADGRSWHEPFALWKDPAGLPAVLREILSRFPDADELAVTMTGELCDCFETKRQGVNSILDTVEVIAGDRAVKVWGTDGQFHSVGESRAKHLTVAAANWHGLATFAGRFAPTHGGLLIDTGSTTTDIIPLKHGTPATVGLTDFDRLKSGELVYTGVKRTMICALSGEKTAAEFFATTHDVNLILDLLPEDAADTDTADSRPATKVYALARLARMLGGDRETIPDEEIVRFAGVLLKRQIEMIAAAIRTVKSYPGEEIKTVIVSGAGEFLVRRALREAMADFPESQIVSLNQQLGDRVSSCAPAYALAVLASMI